MSFLNRLLGTVSGNKGLKVSEQLLFDKVIGFKSVVPGSGASTLLTNTAVALADRSDYTICILDTNFLFPVQMSYLMVKSRDKYKDIIDFSDEIDKVALATGYRNVYLASLINRSIIDMLSSKDSELLVDKIIGTLKTYFDIVLVDLSHELTNINTYAAIRCNKIITVADPSIKCMTHLKKSYNTMASLAINFSKCNRVVLNKQVPDMIIGAEAALGEAGLSLIGTIPLSLEIARLGVSGKLIWGGASRDNGVLVFNNVVDSLVATLVQKTPLNDKYLDVKSNFTSSAPKKVTPEIVGPDSDFSSEIVVVESEDSTSAAGD